MGSNGQRDAESVARSAVADRLNELFTVFGSEQAIQFADRWFTWGDIGLLHIALVEALHRAGRDDNSAIAIIARQRPPILAAVVSTLAQGRCALVVTTIQADSSLASEIEGLRASVVIADPDDWDRPGVLDAAKAVGSVAIATSIAGVTVVATPPTPPAAAPRSMSTTIDAAITVLTSGTTGPAKRLPVPWTTFVSLGGGPEGRTPRSGQGAVILSLPLPTLGGLLTMARLVFGGRPVSMMERFSVQVWAALVREHRPRVVGAPPPVVAMILDADIPVETFEGVTAFVTASAPVAQAIARAFEQRYGIPVLQGYGATEFLGSVTGWTGQLYEKYGASKLGSVGQALPGVAFRVVDPDSLVEVQGGDDGVLEVDPPQRAGHLPTGWLRTADRARIDSDGFVWILGRTDDIIIRGGFKVDLTAVEAALVEHPDVLDACAVGLADDRLGMVPGAAVVLSGSVAVDALMAWVRERVAPYSVPTVIAVVDAIPMTATFKRHRVEVRRLLVGMTNPR